MTSLGSTSISSACTESCDSRNYGKGGCGARLRGDQDNSGAHVSIPLHLQSR
jgi:hypothetical protein